MYNYLTKLLMNKVLIFEPGVSKIKVGKHEFIYDSKHDNITTTNRNGLEMKRVDYLVPLAKNSNPNEQDTDALSVWIDAKHHTIYKITSYVYCGFVHKEDNIFGIGELISMSVDSMDYFKYSPNELESSYIVRDLKG